MKKHILFLVHGMGSYGKYEDGKWVQDTEGWFKEAEKTLRDIYDEFAKNEPKLGAGRTFDECFSIERVIYDDFMEHYRVAWKKQSESWTAFPNDNGVTKAVTKFFKGNKDDAFLWTHAADVLLYTSPLVEPVIWTSVGGQILKALKKHHDNLALGDWSVIAHSLGTAVANSTLQRLRATAAQDPALGAVLSPPRVVCMVANVARALADPSQAYGDMIAPEGNLGVQHYLSCSHNLDPFTRIRPFAPNGPKWMNPNRYAALNDLSGFYLADEFIDWVQDWNDFDKFGAVVPHGFSHYMRQPRVAAQLWPRLMGRSPSEIPNLEGAVRTANEQLVLATIGDHVRKKLEQEVRQRLEAALGGITLPTTKEDFATLLPAVLRQLKGFP